MTERATIRMRARRGGFTVVELLVVVGVIATLVALLIVALAAASSRAQAAKTTALMTSISQALATFERDFNYLPPPIGPEGSDAPNARRPFISPPLYTDSSVFGNAGWVAQLQDYASMTTLAEYLIGYDGAAADGADGNGIRDPGRDRYWNGLAGGGVVSTRQPNQRGPVRGPYLELDDNTLLGRLEWDQQLGDYTVHLPGDPGYNDENDDNLNPLVIVDYWGAPILYYPDHPAAEVSLAEIIVLRPASIKSGAEATSPVADAGGSRVTSLDLRAAKYALFSAGPDKTANRFLRFDDPDDPNNAAGTAWSNEDNIVEVGG